MFSQTHTGEKSSPDNTQAMNNDKLSFAALLISALAFTACEKEDIAVPNTNQEEAAAEVDYSNTNIRYADGKAPDTTPAAPVKDVEPTTAANIRYADGKAPDTTPAAPVKDVEPTTAANIRYAHGKAPERALERAQ